MYWWPFVLVKHACRYVKIWRSSTLMIFGDFEDSIVDIIPNNLRPNSLSLPLVVGPTTWDPRFTPVLRYLPNPFFLYYSWIIQWIFSYPRCATTPFFGCRSNFCPPKIPSNLGYFCFWWTIGHFVNTTSHRYNAWIPTKSCFLYSSDPLDVQRPPI